MRIIFAGTPEFALVALEKLHAAGHDIALVLTQPDRPAGRGMKLQASAVKQWAEQQHISVAQPRSLRLEGKYPDDAIAARDAIVAAQADLMVVAAYGLILPQWVLIAPRLGCLNIHGSLLPRWRGAAPIHRAIEAGDVESGVTIMQMDAGLDTGDMLLTQRLPIALTDTTATLHDKLASLGADMIVDALRLAQLGQLQSAVQPMDGITYASKIDKSESRIDWAQPATVIERRIRAFNPFPVASTQLGNEVIKIFGARIDGDFPLAVHRHGEILLAGPGGVFVGCGDGVLCLTELQRSGGKRLLAADFLRGFEMPVGSILV